MAKESGLLGTWVVRGLALLAASTVLTACTGRGTAEPNQSSAPRSTAAVRSTVLTATTTDACLSRQLRLSRGAAAGASGASYTWYLLVNVARTTCTLTGYPGISEIDAQGGIVGQPAVWSPLHSGAAPPVTVVSPGGVASFLLVTRGDASAPPAKKCFRSNVATQLRVYPPGQTDPLLLGLPGSGDIGLCSSLVTPIEEGRNANE